MIKKPKGFCCEQNIKYAGVHILLEFWQVNKNINSIKQVEQALKEAVKAARATLLNIDLHKFSPQGISGVAVIEESHITIHTWPELRYAALDIFTCGNDVKPYKAVEVLKKAFGPKRIEIMEVKRGVMI